MAKYLLGILSVFLAGLLSDLLQYLSNLLQLSLRNANNIDAGQREQGGSSKRWMNNLSWLITRLPSQVRGSKPIRLKTWLKGAKFNSRLVREIVAARRGDIRIYELRKDVLSGPEPTRPGPDQRPQPPAQPLTDPRAVIFSIQYQILGFPLLRDWGLVSIKRHLNNRLICNRVLLIATSFGELAEEQS